MTAISLILVRFTYFSIFEGVRTVTVLILQSFLLDIPNIRLDLLVCLFLPAFFRSKSGDKSMSESFNSTFSFLWEFRWWTSSMIISMLLKSCSLHQALCLSVLSWWAKLSYLPPHPSHMRFTRFKKAADFFFLKLVRDWLGFRNNEPLNEQGWSKCILGGLFIRWGRILWTPLPSVIK